MKEIIHLFVTFFRIGLFTFGGGYAMLPLLQKEVVEDKKWATSEDLANYYAIGQTTPGIIAVNTATFIGYKQKGMPGAIFATLGLVLPGTLIILALAGLIGMFAELEQVKNAMMAIKVTVTVLILESLLKLRKSSLIDLKTTIIAGIVISIVVLIPNFPPAVLVACAGVMGLLLFRKEKI